MPTPATNDYRFAGEQRNSESGYSYLRARYPSAGSGQATTHPQAAS